MHFTKPAWVIHKDSSKDTAHPKRLSIFSVHVHPDGSRIATGGLDAKVRIWSTRPILNPASELSNKPPKSLSTLTMHTGPVLCVRWAHSGRWLASGSDDEVVMIWDLDPSARGRVWGSDEVNVEGWRPMKRLPGHESDVTDVAWAPGDRYLASVGLDSQVMIWCGFTLERLRKLSLHQGFVKGVCWDPVGEFLATQSDDRTVKIWRTTDWGLEAEVKKPFEDSPGSTFFRRLSWSPDGAHITASNATNNKGFVFIAAVITRNTWTSEISLVGHENTVEVAAYNPHIFLRNPEQSVATANICSVVALGADDRSVSVWQTKSARPLIVAKEVFERQIMDLNWSYDGLTLYAASSDGTIAVFHFDPEELEGIAPHSAQEQYLAKFGFVPPPIPEGYSHAGARTKVVADQTGFDATNATLNGNMAGGAGGGEKVNMLVAKRNNKKRVGLTNGGPRRDSMAMNVDPPQPPPSYFPQPEEQPFAEPGTWSRHNDVPISRRGNQEEREDKVVFRTLGGDRPREFIPIKEIQNQHASGSGTHMGAGMELPIPPLLTRLTTVVDGGGDGDVFQCSYFEDTGLVDVMLLSPKQTLWLDYLPSPALAIKATEHYCAVAAKDGSVYVYSHTGRRLMPNLALGSPCSLMDGSKNALMVITSSGMLYSWAVNKQTVFFPPTSLAPLLSSPNNTPNNTLTSATVRPNGLPILATSSGVIYTYSPQLHTFVKLTEPWWAAGSDAWASGSSTSGVIGAVESTVSATSASSVDSKSRPQWWSTALTLGHLETRMHGAALMGSAAEYRQALAAYARGVAEEGFKDRGEELIKELCGPVYYRDGQGTSWDPMVAGLSKRELLSDVVLAQFAKNKNLAKLAKDYQDLLGKMADDEI